MLLYWVVIIASAFGTMASQTHHSQHNQVVKRSKSNSLSDCQDQVDIRQGPNRSSSSSVGSLSSSIESSSSSSSSGETSVITCDVRLTPIEISNWESFNSQAIKSCSSYARQSRSSGIFSCSSLGYYDQSSRSYGGSLHLFQIGSGRGSNKSHKKSNHRRSNAFNVRISGNGVGGSINSGRITLLGNPTCLSCTSDSISAPMFVAQGDDNSVVQLLGSLHYNGQLDASSRLNSFSPQIEFYNNAAGVRSVGHQNLPIDSHLRSSEWGLFTGLPNRGRNNNDQVVIVADELCTVHEISNTIHNSNSDSNSNLGTTTTTTADASVQTNSVDSISNATVNQDSSGVEIIGSDAGNQSNTLTPTIVSTIPTSSSTADPVSSSTSPDPSGIAEAASASTTAFQLPGRSLSVLPIGLGIFAAVSVIALIIVGVVTYERRKYRKQFRARKMAAQISQAAGYGTDQLPRMGEATV